jgi:hypothetical protein
MKQYTLTVIAVFWQGQADALWQQGRKSYTLAEFNLYGKDGRTTQHARTCF